MIGLDLVVKVSLLVGLGLLATVALRQRSAASRHWTLTSVLLAALVAPALTLVAPQWQLPAAWQPPARVAGGIADGAVTTETVVGPAGQSPTILGAAADGVVAAPVRAPATSRVVARLAWIWLAGVALMGLILLAGLCRLAWLASRARALQAGEWSDAADALTREYGIRPVTLLQSTHPTLLVTWGLWRPRIILPAPAAAWSSTRIRVVLRHELAHIRRGDWSAQLVAEAVRALHWYNPLVWIACRRLREESELACDAALMREGLSGLDYASELLELARVLHTRRYPWTTALAMARPSSLERRVTAMLNEQLDRTPVERRHRALAIGAAMALAVGIAGFTASAQSFSTVSGTAVDQLGGYLPGVTVSLASTEADRKYEVRTDRTGLYQFVGVVPGAYTMRVWQPGFKTITEPLAVAGENMRHNLTLAVGSLEETITLVHRAGESPAPPAASAPRPVMKLSPTPAACTESFAGGMGGSIKAPTKIKDVRPVYPENLGDARRTDVLVFDTIIARDGSIREVTPKDSNAQIDLANAAMAAIRQWRFTPTLLNCVPIEVEMTVTVNFRAE